MSLPIAAMIDKTNPARRFLTCSLNGLCSPRAKKYGLRSLVVVLAIGVLGVFVLPPLVKAILVSQLGDALHRPVSIEQVSINPYALSLQIDGLAIQEKGGGETVAGFASLYVNLEAMSLLRGGPVLKELRLEGPKLKIVRLADHRYNFSDLIDEWLALMAKSDPSAPTTPFLLNNLQISGGALEFDDRPLGARHVVDAIALSLPFVSSLSFATETFVEPSFSARINGATLLVKGRSKPFADSLESEFALALDDLQVARYLGYVPFHLPIKVVSGAVDSDLKLVFRQEKEQRATLTLAGTVLVKELVLSEAAGTPLLAVKRIDLAVKSAELFSRKFAIDRIALVSPEIHAHVNAQGDFNWLALLPKETASGDARIERGVETRVDKSAKPPLKATAPVAPVWSIGEAKVNGGALRWLDESHGKPFRASVEAVDFDLKNFDSAGRAPAEFDVAWRVDADQWLKVTTFSARGGRLDLSKHELLLGEVLAKGVRAMLRRTADGTLDWVKPPTLRLVQASQKDTSEPWKVNVAKYVGEDIGVRFEDAAVSPTGTQVIEGLAFEAENLSTEPGQVAKLATRFRLNSKGQIEVGGNVKFFPLDADLKLDVKTVELLPWQAYFGDRLNISVTRGLASLDGKLKLRQEAAVADTGFVGGFSGRAMIGDFQSVDKANAADFLKWKSLYFGNIDVRHNPDSLSVGEVALSDFFARVIVSPEGKLNLLQMVRPEEPPAEAATQAVENVADAGAGKAVVPIAGAPKPVLPVKIGKVTLQGGSIRFSDNFVKPNYSANLKQIGGRIGGLSSAADSVAEVDLRGSYDNVAPLGITGHINPLAAKPTLDVQAEIKSVELTSLSPYSGKYAGYAIEKGKLSLFVKYKIENNLLEAENRVFIDQLTFGDPVDSPDATKLPVTLAVALLKNRNGEIDINLPISGSLDDPQFSVGGLVLRVIVNLLTKAITSPFALLGLAAGSGEELSSIEFDVGRSVIAAPAQQRLENLAKALLARPALKLEIEGRVDSERDREGLKRVRIERKVRALKREDAANAGSGGDNSAPEVLEVSEQEYPALLERVYRDEKFPKPRNVIGLVKTLPVAEMEKLMLTHSGVDEDDLRALGERRAKAVRDWLVGHEVPVERIFLLPAKLQAADAASGTAEKGSASRANFSLK